MKTTLEIPDETFRKAKARAAMRGIPFRQIVTEALEEKFSNKPSGEEISSAPPWMQGFGTLSDLHEETARINATILGEFGNIETEDRQ